MNAFNRQSVGLFVRWNHIIIDLVLIHEVKKGKAFSFLIFRVFASYLGKDLLEIIFFFSF